MLKKTTTTSKPGCRIPVAAPNNPGHQRKSACDLFTAEFEINDIRPAARNILTKGQTHDEISHVAGASISTRGRFISVAEKRSGVPINDRSLYLFIQGNTKDSVDSAVQRIEEIIQMDGGNPNNYRGAPKYLPNTSAVPALPLQMTMPPPIVSGGMAITSTTNTMHSTNSTCVEKIFIGLDHAPPSFDLRSRLIGTGGANLNYIRTETGAMATLRGRGSLFVDPMLSMESPEPIHLYIEHLRYDGLQAAKQLARNLVETLQQELVQFQQMHVPPMSGIHHYSAQTTVVQQPHIYTQHTMPHQLPLHQIHPSHSLVQIQPPPGMPLLPMKPPTATVAVPPPPPHLSQPPPSLQHLHSHAPTQIVVNQSVPIPIKTMVPMVQTTPQPNYQYQYIHTTGQEATAVPQPPAGPSGAVTIQHIYQAPHPPPPQQYITVQGSTAYMVPPPSLIQTTTQVPITSSIIYSTHAPPQMLQQPPNYSMAHQVITVQQQQGQTQQEVKLEVEKAEEEFAGDGGQQRGTMAAPPPIMSVPPPTVQHILVPNSYAANQMQPNAAAAAAAQQFVINSSGWSHAAATTSQPHTVHLGQPPMHGMVPMEYRPGSGGTTYQQLQHPIMTATTSMGMPVQYPPMMKMNHQMPPPPFSAGQPQQLQPVGFPTQQQQQENAAALMRSGQKRKMMGEENGVDGANGGGHGDPNSRHGRMSGGGPYGSQMEFVATSSAANAAVGRMNPMATVASCNTNASNDLSQESYAAAAAGHRLGDERTHSVNQMVMGHGEIGDPHQAVEPSPLDDGPYQNEYPGGDLSHPPPNKIGGPPPAGQMSMVRCNIMGKPPPPLPHLARVSAEPTSILANATQQQMQRYSQQQW